MWLSAISTIVRIFAAAAFLGALMLSPYITREPQLETSGWTALLLGWLSILDHKMTAWLANPLLIVSIVKMKSRPGLSVALSVLALLAAHDFAKFESLGWDSSKDIYAGRIIGLDTGAYFWLASLILTAVASVLQWSSVQPTSPGHRASFWKPTFMFLVVVLSAFPLLIESNLIYRVDPYNRVAIRCKSICNDPQQKARLEKFKKEWADSGAAPLAPSADECDCG